MTRTRTLEPAAADWSSPGRRLAARDVHRARPRLGRVALAAIVWTVLVGNAVGIVWLWARGGNLSINGAGDLLTSIARLTGLLGAYSALLQVVLLSRIPWLERLTSFDRLTIWHRRNGYACLYLVLAHVLTSVWGYALLDRISLPSEVSTMLGGGVYPGMITATVGTGLLVAVAVSSVVIVRRRLPYEAWYAVHFSAYAAIALGWFHQIPTGNELVLDTVAADYWRGLYAATLALVVVCRVLTPLANAFRFGMRVAEVVPEGPGVVSLRITGRHLERLHARAGQFLLWRFLSRGRWWASHPFSLSAAPDGRSLRITIKALGDFTSQIAAIPPGTRVVAEGPFGVFTAAAQRKEKVLLIAGGIGITPIRALLEELPGDIVCLYRVISEEDIVFADELDALARDHGIRLEYVVGDHMTPAGRNLLSPRHLRHVVPDITERDVYVCGPPAMAEAVEKNVRRAHVPRHQIHTERFAL